MIHFNYKQSNKFKFIEKYMNKITFLIKFIDVNYDSCTIKFDYDALNSFNEKAWIMQLEKYNFNLRFNTDGDIDKVHTPNIKQEKKINLISKKKIKNKNTKKNSPKKEKEKIVLNNNINKNPNKAEFIGDSNKNTLTVEIKEPAIILKHLETNGKMKLRKYNITEKDENQLTLNKNIIDIFKSLCDLSQEYIKKENDKKAEISGKGSEKNLYYSYNKKLVK